MFYLEHCRDNTNHVLASDFTTVFVNSKISYLDHPQHVSLELWAALLVGFFVA